LAHGASLCWLEVSLETDLEAIAEAAASFAGAKETLVGIVPAEPAPGDRLYLCAYRWEGGDTGWLVLDGAGRPVTQRSVVREAVSIVAMCELAADGAAGGDLEGLRARLAELRESEDPVGIDDAEQAVEELQAVVGMPPALATPQRLDAIGVATRRLELALGNGADSPFARTMSAASQSIQAFTADVEAAYKVPLD
jgi:hypothetical protein